jgi:hypothetical protein
MVLSLRTLLTSGRQVFGHEGVWLRVWRDTMSRSEWNVDHDQRSSGVLPNPIASNSNSGGKVQLFEPAEPVSDE